MTRILRQTPDETVIEDRPWGLGLFLCATLVGTGAMLFQARDEGSIGLALAALLLATGAGLWLFKGIRHVRLTLPNHGPARLWIRSFEGVETRLIPRETLRAAVDSNRTDNSVTVRLMLLIDSPDGVERVPFTEYYTGITKIDPIVETIMNWRRSA